MDLKTLQDIPPWDWPQDAGEMFLRTLHDGEADATERLIAAELGGNLTVINDDLAAVLMAIVESGVEAEDLRCKAAISLGPVLEQADTFGFEDPDDVPITEQTFHTIQKLFRTLYMDAAIPKHVRRRILEAAVRSPLEWHRDAVRAAYQSDDEDWRLTAVFGMHYVGGFDEQIIEALGDANPDIHYEAVCAAGNQAVAAAWSHISALITSKETEKPLLLAAIDAVAGVRPKEAGIILVDLVDSEDDDIAEAANEAIVMAEVYSGLEDYDEEDDG